MNWRPIKTAPKDRQILLACLENCENFYVCQGRWVDVPHTNEMVKAMQAGGLSPARTLASLRKPEGRWMEAYIAYMATHDVGHTYEDRIRILFRPTHWMPLPGPPKSRRAWLRARKLIGQD